MIRTIAFWPLCVVVVVVVVVSGVVVVRAELFHRVNSAPIRRADVDGVAGTRVAAMASAGVVGVVEHPPSMVVSLMAFFVVFVALLLSSSSWFSTSKASRGRIVVLCLRFKVLKKYVRKKNELEKK